MTPELLITGHIVKDVTPGGWTPGGGALYAAAQAARLGLRTLVVTACEDGIEPADLVPGASWYVQRLESGTRFENIYSSTGREQRIQTSRTVTSLGDIPEVWRGIPYALFAPVFHDVDPAEPARLAESGARVFIAAQGWLRRRDGSDVVPGVIEAAPAWLRGEAVFLSEEDVADAEAAAGWRHRVGAVVLTRGRRGCTVWDARGRHDVPTVPACERDPTGAGDVFAAAYVARFIETGDVLASASFGAAAAALAVEAPGLDAIGDREQIEARMQTGAPS